MAGHLSERWPVPAIRFYAMERPRLLGETWPDAGEPPPLVLLSGPAGSGKTVAAAQHAARLLTTRPVRWVDLAGLAEHPERVWAHLLAAIGDSVAGLHGGDDYGRLEAAVAALTEPTVLVIDDWHCVSNARRDLALAGLVEHRALLTLVVLSRHFTSLAGPAIAARMDVRLCAAETLAFTSGEIAMLTSSAPAADARAVAELHRLTDGWPIAVRAVLTGVRAERQLSDRELSIALEEFASDFVAASWFKLTEACRRTLLGISICGPITPERLARVVGRPEAEVTVEAAALEREGLVFRLAGGGRGELTCPIVLRPLLAARATQELGVDTCHTLQQRAGRMLAEEDPVAGLRLLVEVRDLAGMQGVFERDFAELLERRAEAQQLLSVFAVAEFDDFPILLGARLIVGYADPAIPQTSIDRWHQTLRGSVKRHLRRGVGLDRVLLLTLLTAAERMAGNGADAHRHAQELEQAIAERSGEGAGEHGSGCALIHSVIALTGLMNGDLHMATRHFTVTQEAGARGGHVGGQLRGLNGLALSAAVAGDIREAEQRMREVDELTARSGLTAPDLSWLQGEIARAYIALERWDGGALREILDRVEPWVTRMELWPLFTIVEAALVRLRHGEQRALVHARARIAEARAGFRSTSHVQTMLAAYLASLAMVSGDLSRTEAELEQMSVDHPDVAVARARLAFARVEYDRAIQIAVAAKTLGPTPRLRGELMFLIAVSAWRLGSREQAFSALSEGAEWSLERGLKSPLASVPYDWLAELASAAREAGVIDLKSEVRQMPPEVRIVLTEPLSEAEVRTLQAVGGGATIDEASATLFLSKNTVKFHLRSIYRKLNAADRTEAVRRATRLGLIEH